MVGINKGAMVGNIFTRVDPCYTVTYTALLQVVYMWRFRASRSRKAQKVSASLVTSAIVLVLVATTFSVVAASPRPSVTAV